MTLDCRQFAIQSGRFSTHDLAVHLGDRTKSKTRTKERLREMEQAGVIRPGPSSADTWEATEVARAAYLDQLHRAGGAVACISTSDEERARTDMTEAKNEHVAIARAIAATVGWDFDQCPPTRRLGELGRWTQQDFLDAAAAARARLDNVMPIKSGKQQG